MRSEQRRRDPRLFTAIELSDRTRDFVREVVGQMSDDLAGVRWVPPDNLHVTLRFLGPFSMERIDQYSRWMEKASRHLPFVLRVGGVSGFPSPSSARVVYVGARDDSGRVKKVYDVLDKGAAACGLNREGRSYTPHITVARARKPVKIPGRIVERYARDWLEMKVDRLVLYRSTLSSEGSEYSVIHSVGNESARTDKR